MMALNSTHDNPFLAVEHVSKAFPGVIALEDVSFEIARGQVHGLVGKNGAGKSTLIKIISGLYLPDQGRIQFDGQCYTSLDPAQARSLGIHVVPQEQQFQPHLNVAENMFVGSWPTNRLGFVKFHDMERQTKEALAKLNINIAVSTLAKNLSLVQRQIVAIARAIFLNARLIILDEPTPALTATETELLFKFVRELADQGISFIYISHYLNEVFEVCDTVSVLKNGQLIHTGEVKNLTPQKLVGYMVGRKIESSIVRGECFQETVLELDSLTSYGTFVDISFSIQKGEIVGLTGLMGCGAFQLAKSLFGLFPLDNGNIIINGKSIKIETPWVALKNGIALLPDDRRALGLVLDLPVVSNINLSNFGKLTDRFGFISDKKQNEIAKKFIRLLDISTPSLIQEVKFLSGGNQQKVVVSRLLNTDPTVIIMMDPTAGIDIEAKAEIHRLIDSLTKVGLSILLLSTDMDELLNLSDRVLVMHKGKIVKEFSMNNATKENILSASEGIIEAA